MGLRQYFGWHDPRRGFLVSREPPDATIRPALAFDSADEAIATMKRKRGEILWWPKLSGNECQSIPTHE